MKKPINYFATILLSVLLLMPSAMDAQMFARKKYKNAPDETIVIVTNPHVENFNAEVYPHLRFFYIPEEMPHFIDVLRRVLPIPGDNSITGMVIDKEGTIAYVRQFSNELAKNNDADYGWTMLSVANPTGRGMEKKKLDEFLVKHIRKNKVAKRDPKKVYTEGEVPTFKDWSYGRVYGMELPDFDLVAQDGSEVKMKDVLDGKSAFIVFTKIAENGRPASPMLWNIENILYNYFPPRKKR